MVLYAILLLSANILSEFGFQINLGLHSYNFTLAASILGNEGWIWSGFFTLITGLIGIYGYFDLVKPNQKNELLFLWGIFGVVLGLVGGTIGGWFIILAGIMLIIAYFRN
jgi:hypothetical protein